MLLRMIEAGGPGSHRWAVARVRMVGEISLGHCEFCVRRQEEMERNACGMGSVVTYSHGRG